MIKKAWQKKNKLKINIGDFVKVAIYDKKTRKTEHLWFELLAVNKRCPTCNSKDFQELKHKEYTHICNKCGDKFCEFVGRCSNMPLKIENIKLDGITYFQFKDIEDYNKNEKV